MKVKLLATIAFCLNILALYIIKGTPVATGYEFSIYNAYPAFLWIIILVSYTCGLLIYIIEVSTDNKNSRLWTLGWFSIFFTNIIILLLPYFRGYPLSDRGDTIIHLGIIKDIIYFGHLDDNNFYPIVHILGSIIALFSQLNLNNTNYIAVLLFPVLYLIGIVLLSRSVSKTEKQSVLIIAFGSSLIFAGVYTPEGAAFSLLPLTYYLFFKRIFSKNKVCYTYLILLFIIAITYFHPLVSVYLILTFLCIQISFLIYRYRAEHFSRLPFSPINSVNKMSNWWNLKNIILIGLSSWFMWFSSFSIFKKGLLRVSACLFSLDQSQTMRYVGIVEKSKMSIFEVLGLFIKMYGQYILYLTLTIVSFIFLFNNIRKNKKIDFSNFMWSSIFILFSFFLIAYAVSDVMLTYARMFMYLFFASTFINGLFISEHIRDASPKNKRKIYAFLFILLLLSQAFTLFNIYPSPVIKKHNYEVTEQDLAGMSWFLARRNENLLTNDVIVWPYRLAVFVKGFSSPKVNLSSNGSENTLPPDHFDYSNQTIYDKESLNNRYILINKISENYYKILAPKNSSLIRFNQQDFDKLDFNKKTFKVYSNGEFKAYQVMLAK